VLRISADNVVHGTIQQSVGLVSFSQYNKNSSVVPASIQIAAAEGQKALEMAEGNEQRIQPSTVLAQTCIDMAEDPVDFASVEEQPVVEIEGSAAFGSIIEVPKGISSLVAMAKESNTTGVSVCPMHPVSTAVAPTAQLVVLQDGGTP
jgi:hypothetical protein